METANKNAPADKSCTHGKTLERLMWHRGDVRGCRMCVYCGEVVEGQPVVRVPPKHEDPSYPSYWDCTPDLQTHTRRGTITLLLSLAGLLIVAATLISGATP